MRIVALGLLALLGLGVGAAQAAPVAAPVVAEPLAEKDGLRISISATHFRPDPKPPIGFGNGRFAGPTPEDSIAIHPGNPQINVVLQNVSSQPINIISEGNSWGAELVTLEITEIDGKAVNPPLIVRRRGLGWGGNSLGTETIPPGEAIVREVRFPPLGSTDKYPNAWLYRDFPLPEEGAQKRLTIRAVFSHDTDIDLKDYGREGTSLFKGKIASPSLSYTLGWDGK